MKLSKAQRETVRMMFGGFCAYCGVLLGKTWHADHVDPVVRCYQYGEMVTSGHGFTSYQSYGHGKKKIKRLDSPENDCAENFFPSCRACNIHKSVFGLEAWRIELGELTGFLQRGYPTYRHALRFGLIVETSTPIVFWFEKFKARESKT